MNLQQRYETFSGPDIDVGNRVSRTTYRTLASAEYACTDKTFLSAHADYTINVYEKLIGFNEAVLGGAADYFLTPKIKLGIGSNLGLVDVSQGIDQTYEQALGRIAYTWSDKVDVQLSAGAEVRQFDSTEGARINPVFALDLNYRPEPDIKISLESYRREQTSAVMANHNFMASGLRTVCIAGALGQVYGHRQDGF